MLIVLKDMNRISPVAARPAGKAAARASSRRHLGDMRPCVRLRTSVLV